jgi:hypothetical protein
MRTVLHCAAALLLMSIPGWSADQFPAIGGDNLLGAKVALPDAAKGHVTAIVVGFTHASQTQTQAWSAKIASQLDYYSIAVIEDAPRLVRGMISSGMKSSVAKDQRDRFVLATKGEKELKEAAGFDKPDDAYLLLIDRDGQIRWRFHGPVSDGALGELKSQAAGLGDAK